LTKHHQAFSPLILHALLLLLLKTKTTKANLPGRPSPSLACFPSASDASSAL